MIPVLYDKSERDFSHNGIGFLSDATRATVTEERNGSFELSMQYSISGAWFGLIQNGSIIKAKPNETSEPQLFRVYKVSKPLNGIVTYSAEHISYDLSGVPALGFSLSNTTAEAAMKQAVSGAVVPCPYAVHSDIADKRPFAIEAPASVRSILGAVRDTFGGEFEFDNFSAYLHKARGQDNGVTIEYGKNLTDLKQEDNISDCYTHILPYAAYQVEPEEYDENAEPETVYVYLPEKILPIPDAESLGHIKAYPIDFSDRFEDGADYTEAALRELAEDYLSDTDIGTPKVNLTVSFVQLWQTEEYKNIASLERVKLCDIVTVKFLCLGVESKAEVIKTVFDVLGERYESIALGDVKETLADTIIEAEKEIKTIKKSTDRIESHIKRTDERITLEVLHIVENEKELLSRIELTESSITAEVSRATTEEGKLSSRITQTAESISAEITRATGAEADLSSRIELTAESLTSTITAEKTRAEKAESLLSSDITGEIDRAKGAEEVLGSRITTTESTLKSEIKQTAESITSTVEAQITETSETLTGLIDKETKRADKVEKELSSRIAQTAESITSEITAKITTEMERAETAEENLSSRITQTAESISAEITRATGAEADLSGKIELTAESLTTTLTAKVTEEADRAMKAEKELSSTITQTAESLTSTFTAKITEETDRAGAAEETLSSRITQNAESISAEITRATSAEADLSSNITQTVNKIRLSVSSKTTNDQTESTISITNGTTVLNSVKVTGTTAEQASKIAIDAVNGITLSVTNSTTNASSTIAIKSGSTTISSAKIEFTGLVTFANLKDGKTEISGDNITTGKISADRIDVDKICVTDVYSKSGTSKVVVIATDGNSSLTIGGPDYNSSSNVSDVYIRAQQSLQIGRYASSNNNLYFDINNRTVRPYYSSNSYRWSLGTGTYPFASIYAAKLCIHPDNNTNGEYGIFIHNNSIYSNRTNAYCGTNTYPWAYGYFNSLTAKTSLMAATSVQLGTATNSTVGFYGSTPTTRRTISKVMNPSTATTSQVATVLNNLMTALQAYGLIG